MAEVLPVALLVNSSFSVILLVVRDKNILAICVFCFVGPHKHILLLDPTALHENITVQLCSFSLKDEITTLWL